ncbi:VOC family protein [Pelagibius litoralis]|uniref:VOC family protein n=1 Tax=Pelagibius litoralis TaxID=374515 RepID=A0A967C9A7_9PROT|nr:VOC family protein [Pelagibius litoralis]NIA68962.1 VOC family protein [Pelagibius litoralis]
MAKVLGLGGLFMACADPEATKAWYARVLGLQANDYGGFDFLQQQAVEAFPGAARTVFAPFDAKSDYFAPSTLPFMLNLMVDDLDGMLARAKAGGVEPVQPGEDYDYGRFAWLMDPDGRKVELWEPVSQG